MASSILKTLFKREKTYLIVITLWVLPYFVLGQQAHMRIQDNLDSNIAWYKVLNSSGQLFGSIKANIPQIINGQLFRTCFIYCCYLRC